MIVKTEMQGNTRANLDDLGTTSSTAQSSKYDTASITFTDDGCPSAPAAFSAKDDGVAYIDESESVRLALAPALFVAR